MSTSSARAMRSVVLPLTLLVVWEVWGTASGNRRTPTPTRVIGAAIDLVMMKLAQKDCRLALRMVEELGVAAPVGRAALASLDEGVQRGLQDHDVGALLKLREEAAGVEVRTAKT